MNLQHVESFLMVVRAGGFREASKLTGIPQPTLSQQISKLEQALGATLLQRGKGGCRLSIEGERLLPYAQTLLRTAERARALFDGNSVAVGASSNIGVYLLPRYLRSYRDRRPEVQIELQIEKNPEIVERLTRREIEIAVTEWWDDRPGFQAHRWRCEELVLIVAPAHPWSRLEQITAAQLADVRLLGGESGTGTRRLFKDRLGDLADRIEVSAQLGSTEAVKHAVQAGLGVSLVMASSVVQEVQRGALHALPVADVSLVKELYVVSATRHGVIGDFFRHLADAPHDTDADTLPD